MSNLGYGYSQAGDGLDEFIDPYGEGQYERKPKPWPWLRRRRRERWAREKPEGKEP